MNRSLLKVLLAVVVAGILGTLIARDAGYVMVSYGQHSIQTGLWVFLGLVAAGLAVLFYGYRTLRFALAAGGLVRAWRSERQKSRARRLTSQGMAYFNAGQMDRALRFLTNNANVVENPAINYLYAARAANALGKDDERERLLRQAAEADPAWQPAAMIARAEMQLDAGDFAGVLETLEAAGSSDTVDRLKSRALHALRDWRELEALMPAMKKRLSADELHALQVQIALDRLKDAADDNELVSVFKKQPQPVRHDKSVISLYCDKLEAEDAAESAIREALNREWLPHLVSLYGSLGNDTLSKRIRTAEAWLRQHADDPLLQLCLGKLYEASGELDKARTAFRKSVDLDGPAEASHHLGRVLAFDGNYKESSEQLSRALSLRSD